MLLLEVGRADRITEMTTFTKNSKPPIRNMIAAPARIESSWKKVPSSSMVVYE
jgi:hypothetical protein